MDFQTKNGLKSKYYKLFDKKVDAIVVDYVLEGCNYDEKECFEKLSQMCLQEETGPPLPVKKINHSLVGSVRHDPMADNHGTRSPPPFNSYPIQGVPHDPMADNHGTRSPPFNSQFAHGVRHDPMADNHGTRSPPLNSYDPMANNFGLRSPPHTSQMHESENFQQANPSAPPLSIQPSELPVNPPPYTPQDPHPINQYVPKQLYPSLPEKPLQQSRPPPSRAQQQPTQKPPPPARPPPPKQTFIQEDSDDDEELNQLALGLVLRLELLRRIVEVSEEKNRPRQVLPREDPRKKVKQDIPATLSMHGFPKHWPRSNRGVTIIPVNGDANKSIEAMFMDRPFNAKIQSIEELCNFNVYEEFTVRKHCLDEQKTPFNECQLWYPAREKDVENTCYQGIDFQHDISTGPLGKGKYFFTCASAAHRKKGSKHLQEGSIAYMFLCDVVAGDKTKGNNEFDFAPINEKGMEYGCSVDSLDNPSLYILHNKNSCYPRYLITYKVNVI